jgi:hypothetical protein
MTYESDMEKKFCSGNGMNGNEKSNEKEMTIGIRKRMVVARRTSSSCGVIRKRHML